MRLPRLSSVVKIICSGRFSPFFSKISAIIKNCVIVSEVAPDLDMTLKQVSSGTITSRRACILTGSTLSST